MFVGFEALFCNAPKTIHNTNESIQLNILSHVFVGSIVNILHRSYRVTVRDNYGKTLQINRVHNVL